MRAMDSLGDENKKDNSNRRTLLPFPLEPLAYRIFLAGDRLESNGNQIAAPGNVG